MVSAKKIVKIQENTNKCYVFFEGGVKSFAFS